MKDQFDEASFNEAAITDVETARLALRWALDKLRTLQEETLRAKQNLQEKTAQTAFLEGQLKGKSAELEKILHSHDEELKSRQNSLEYQFRSKLDRLSEREKELEDKVSRQEEILKQKENKLLDDYQKKSDELRARWAQVEAELWKLRQEQMTKQQEFEKLYAAKLEDERRKAAAEIESVRAGFERTHADRLADFEKRERSVNEELKKQEAVLKWAKDSFQVETAEREKALRQKDLDIDKKLMGRNQEIEEYKVKVGLLEKQLSDLPEAVRKRDEDLDRYKKAIESLESVIRTIEGEKKSVQADAEHKLLRLNESLEAEKARYREMEAEIPRRLKTAIEHERGRLAEKLTEVENAYKDDLRKRAEEIAYLERNLKTFEENSKTFQTERDAYSHKLESLHTQYNIKLEEWSFREKQLLSEYDVKLKVEMEKKTAALREEVETAQRIYEDNLRFKAEEIAHLRRELEGVLNDKAVAQTQAAESRRAIDAVKTKSEADLAALRGQLKTAHDRELSDELFEAGKRQAAERQRLSAAFEAQLNDVRRETARKEEELQKLKTSAIRLEEEKASAVSEERQRGKAELEVQASSFSDTVKIYEDKILQLNRAMESLKMEREEMILLERERLERLYSEKEKDLEERMSRRDQEAARLREEAGALRRENEALVSGTAREKEADAGRLRVLNERLLAKDAEAQHKLEEVVKREADRTAELLYKKNQELEAMRLGREAQEDAYRRSLEEFRSKLSEAVDKLEILKKAADERGARADALQTELAQFQKFSSQESTAVSARLTAREHDLRDAKAEHEAYKASSEEAAAELQRRANDCLLRLKNLEEQQASKDRTIETLRRDMNFWKGEASKKEEEISGLKGSFAKTLDLERKDGRLNHEKALADSLAREKAVTRDLMDLKDALSRREVEADRLRVRAEELEKTVARFQEQSRHQAGLDAASAAAREDRLNGLEAENAELRKISQEYEQSKKVIDQLKEKLRSWKNQ
ncbi:MAG: hypothetical protein WCW52_06385 [Elusimicrobiales bacterium]